MKYPIAVAPRPRAAGGTEYDGLSVGRGEVTGIWSPGWVGEATRLGGARGSIPLIRFRQDGRRRRRPGTGRRTSTIDSRRAVAGGRGGERLSALCRTPAPTETPPESE
ncbi:hypothetical protein GCM10027515_33150 [Schumannella luteola]